MTCFSDIGIEDPPRAALTGCESIENRSALQHDFRRALNSMSELDERGDYLAQVTVIERFSCPSLFVTDWTQANLALGLRNNRFIPALGFLCLASRGFAGLFPRARETNHPLP